MDDETTGVGTSLLSRNANIEGNISGEENLLINGFIKGTVKLEGDIIVGATGVVEADVEANNIIIEGTVKGNVIAREHLEILSTGRMIGDISARSIDLKEGSSFEGRSHMIKSTNKEPGPVQQQPPAVNQPTGNDDTV